MPHYYFDIFDVEDGHRLVDPSELDGRGEVGRDGCVGVHARRY